MSLAIKSVFKNIRVKKEDSAFVYFIMESYEGITSYSTLPNERGVAYRELELRIPPDFVQEVGVMLKLLGDMICEISAD